MEHRLPPGTQLVEERLGRIFGVSRTKIRQAIGKLAHDRIVTVIPKRGAFVSSLSPDEAHAVFDARRLIEPELIRRVARDATPWQIARLRAHGQREAAASLAQDRRAVIVLSGEFHQLIADMAGNPFLARTLRELESLTSLIITLYEAPAMPVCSCDAHSELLERIETHDAEGAADEMLRHLDRIEQGLGLASTETGKPRLEEIFTR